MQRFDFHIHTSCSDGAAAPAEALALAAAGDLAGVSITDHDTSDAYARIGKAVPPGLQVLPGIEVSASVEGEEVHILGYFPGGLPDGLGGLIQVLLDERLRRIRKGLGKLGERGIDVSWNDVQPAAEGKVLSRGHLAQILVRKGYVPSISAAFPEILGPGTISPPGIDAREVVREIRRLGGIPIWAHPLVEQAQRHLDRLVESDLAGIELHTPRRRRDERRRLRRIIEGKGLIVSGGSDWHGQEPEALGAFAVGSEEVGDFLRAIGWA